MGLEAMPAIGSPETTARRHDSDDGVEKTPSLIDNVGKPFVADPCRFPAVRTALHLKQCLKCHLPQFKSL
jgi:hypothetical protein